MDMKPRIPLMGGNIIPDNELKGNIEFRNVKFAYPSRPEQVGTQFFHQIVNLLVIFITGCA